MTTTAKFVKQRYGATVATILETDDSIVEVQERNDGVYGLIVHHRREDRDNWDDITAYLKPEHFDALGSVARRMRGECASEPTAEGQDADAWYRQTKRLESLCLELNADLARMKATLEWYANPNIYKPHPHGPAFDDRDLSYHALAALKGTSP